MINRDCYNNTKEHRLFQGNMKIFVFILKIYCIITCEASTLR